MAILSTRGRAKVIASLLACSAFVPAAAFAQTADSAASPGAQPSEGATDIVVTGIRGATARAQEIKRHAPTVVEAITVQDLGKFADASVADAIQRIPGVQISRNDDASSGDRASIRGLGAQYVNTTINGREALSYGDYGGNFRSFNFDTVPSEILTGVKVYKTASAELVEPGLAGEIELQTLRPLDYHGHQLGAFFGGLSLRGDYDDRRKKVSPRVSGFLGAKNKEKTIGAYVAFTITDNKRRQDENQSWNVTRDVRLQDTVGGPVRTIAGASVADEWNLRVIELTRKRRTVSTGVQWRPDDHWNINADFSFNKYDIAGTTDTFRIIPGEPGVYLGIFQPGGIKFNNRNQMIALDTSKVIYDDPANQPSNTDQANHNFPAVLLGNELAANTSETYTGGLNVEWKNDDWRVSADYNKQVVRAKNTFQEFYTYSQVLPIQYDGMKPGAIKYNIGGNYLDQSTYRCIYSAGFYGSPAAPAPACFFLSAIQFRGDREAARMDIAYDFKSNVTLKIGGRWQDTEIDRRSGADFSEVLPGRYDQLRAAYLTGKTRDTFPGVGIDRVPLVNSAAACKVYAELCAKDNFGKGSFGGAFPTSLANNPQDVLQAINGGDFFRVSERNIATYAQLDLSGRVATLPFESNLGFRAVNLRLKTRGFTSQTLIDNPTNGAPRGNSAGPVSVNNDYWEFLPSFNITLHPTHDLNLRLGAARVMSLPQYEQTEPNSALVYAQNPQGLPGSATSGNPLIKPTTSWNFDITAEYYTHNKGSIVASAFYKDATNFILNDTVNASVLPGFVPLFPQYATPDSKFNISQPINFSNGYAYGFEIGMNQPFTFLPSPWDGFGVQANYTYVDSKFSRNDPRITFGFPGSSKTNVNVIGYYEKYGFATRVAYTYRSDYFNAFGDGGGYRTAFAGFTAAETELDASISYQITPRIEIGVSGQNLTRQGRSDYNVTPDFFRAAFTRPRVLSFSVRGSL